MWKREPTQAVIDIRQEGEVLRVSVTRDSTAEERLPTVGMLVMACIMLFLVREAPWQLLFFLLLAIGVLFFQVFFGKVIYRSSLEASRDGLTFRRDSGLVLRQSRFIPAKKIRNLLYDSEGKATEPGLCAKRASLPDICVLPYVDEAQAVELRRLIFEHMALTPEAMTISRPVEFR